jgi:hypothetical protein
VVRLTERGWDAAAVIRQTVVEVEKLWQEMLGEETYRDLRNALALLEERLDQPPD